MNNLESIKKEEESDSLSESIGGTTSESQNNDAEQEIWATETAELDNLSPAELETLIESTKDEIAKLDIEIEKEQKSDDKFEYEHFDIPPYCIPINADVMDLCGKEHRACFDNLAKQMQFDVIVMDPPWQLASAAPTRGVALGYSQLKDNQISQMPIEKLSTDGFIFIWVINARYNYALELMKQWGYKMVDDIAWVKATVNRRTAKGHGFYLQHAKESCLVGIKGNPQGLQGNLDDDVIFAERRGQSQKPTDLYDRIENFIPNGKYLEIFARRNNLRNMWVSIGNEL